MNLLKDKKIFIFDLDGTVYKGIMPIPGAKSTIDKLYSHGKQVIFLTNNATKTRESFVKKLKKMDIDCTKDQILSSGYITSLKLAQDPKIKSVFVIGTDDALVNMIETQGTQTLNSKYSTTELYAPYLDSSIKCDAVITSLDHKFTYAKIRTAMELINRGALFYATNGDTTFPEDEQLWPGGGVMLAAVQASVGKAPTEIFGKPSTHGLEMIYEKVKNEGISLQDMVLIGDRFETDILQANRMGIDSVYVDTGVNSPADLEAITDQKKREEFTPTYFISSIKELFD